MRLRSRFVGAAAMSIVPVVLAATGTDGMTTGTATVVSMVWITAAAWMDSIGRHLPDPLVVMALLPTAMAAAVLLMHGSSTAATGVGYGAAIWALPLLAAHVIAPRALGFGDVKAAGVLGAVAGLTQPAVLVAAGLAIALAAAAATAVARRCPEIALGPFLAGGAIASLSIGRLGSVTP